MQWCFIILSRPSADDLLFLLIGLDKEKIQGPMQLTNNLCLDYQISHSLILISYNLAKTETPYHLLFAKTVAPIILCMSKDVLKNQQKPLPHLLIIHPILQTMFDLYLGLKTISYEMP